MGIQLLGNVPPLVHELTKRLAQIVEDGANAPSDKNKNEFNELCEKIEALGFTVAFVFLKDEDKFKLAVFRLDGGPVLH